MSLNSLYCYHKRIVIVDRGIVIGGNQKIEEQRLCNKDIVGKSLLIAKIQRIISASCTKLKYGIWDHV